MGEFLYRLRQFYYFTAQEVRDLVLIILILALIVGFDDGRESFNLAFWLGNYLVTLLMMAAAVLVHVSAHKAWALKIGYNTEFRPFWYIIIIGVLFTLLSGGKLWFLAFGMAEMHHLKIQRLGKFRYGINNFDQGTVAFMGPLASILFAIVLKLLGLLPFVPAALMQHFVLINIWIAVCNSLPIPGLSGLQMFFGSRPTYVFYLGIIVGAALFVSLTANLAFIVFGSLLVGGLFWLVYIITFESTKGR
ncbi:hypothetical protein JXB02_03350 [Candidatus Woesearchaeota archaeon]|nr:hypothetical protein [Candidatus Woesearchaeota archaeon]